MWMRRTGLGGVEVGQGARHPEPPVVAARGRLYALAILRPLKTAPALDEPIVSTRSPPI